MSIIHRRSQSFGVAASALAIWLSSTAFAEAQTAQRDGIADLIGRKPDAAAGQLPQSAPPSATAGAGAAQRHPTRPPTAAKIRARAMPTTNRRSAS